MSFAPLQGALGIVGGMYITSILYSQTSPFPCRINADRIPQVRLSQLDLLTRVCHVLIRPSHSIANSRFHSVKNV